MLKMILYHGSDCDFDEVDLGKSREKRDFGTGFYTTTISVQAEKWAMNKKIRNAGANAYVYVYEAMISDTLLIQRYDGLSLNWLEMVKRNRQEGGLQHHYDIVIGPVANDDTMLTVNRYIQGIYSAEEAIERLRFSRANDQVSFHTERAVKCLQFVRRYRVD